MNIQQLEYILAVDTYRHFAKAAEHCRVTQPTLSMMIQKLEDELGVKLFDRNIQPVCPTPAGRKVIDQARVVLYQTSLIKDIVNEEEQSLKGTFRLAVLPTIAPYLLPRFFQQVSEKHPDLDIRILIELPGDAAGDGVKLHAVTLAVRHIVRQQAEEIPDAAGWLQNIAPLEAQVLYGLVYGLNDNGGGIVGVQRGCPGGFVLRFGQCRL